ncbi:MAG: PEP-CTERM sorting domain-containing protein [Planctomycetota bacterium]
MPALRTARGDRSGRCAALALSLFLASSQATHATELVLGPADSLALDQPRITFGLTDESTIPGTLIGPPFFNSGLLDTGANGILLAGPAYRDSGGSTNPNLYGSVSADLDGSGVIEPDEMNLQYAELGVAGTTLLDLHELYGLRITDSDNVERLVNTEVRAFGDSSLNIGSFGAVVGMPAMEGFAVEVDMRPNASLGFQRVVFHDSIAGAAIESPNTMNVDLRIVEPEFTDSTLIDAGFPELLPTFAGLPVIDNVDMRHTGGATSGGATLTTEDNVFLVDTGAQTVIISQQMATEMGIDFTMTLANGGDIVDFLEVGGIGGSVQMPLVTVDEFIMPTQGGIDLVWTDLLVGVLDIGSEDGIDAPFDAVFGMNMLTTGYLAAAFGGGGGPNTITNPSIDEDGLQILVDLDTVNDVDDLFDLGLITISREDYDLLVDSEILPDTADPVEAYAAAKALDAELGAGEGLTAPLFDKVVFDFTPDDGTAVMRLDFNESVVVPEPSSLLLITLAGATIITRRRR